MRYICILAGLAHGLIVKHFNKNFYGVYVPVCLLTPRERLIANIGVCIECMLAKGSWKRYELIVVPF